MDPNTQQPQQPVTPQLTQQPIVQNAPAKSQLSKVILSILGVLIVVGLVGGAYYLGTQKKTVMPQGKTAVSVTQAVIVTPTTVPTSDGVSNWKTYTSPLGYSLQYPSDWVLNPKYTDPQGNLGPESIAITDAKGDKLVFDYGYRPLGVPPHVFKTENITVDGSAIVKAYNDGCDFDADGSTVATASCKNKTTQFYQITYATLDGVSSDPTVVDSSSGTRDYAWTTGSQSVALGMNNFHGKASYLVFVLHDPLAVNAATFDSTNTMLDKIVSSIKFTK
jgi:hypothetical protein